VRHWWIWTAVFVILAYGGWAIVEAAGRPYPAHYEYDEGVYAETASAAADGARPYRDIFLSQPPVLVLVVAQVYRAGWRTLTAARLCVTLFSLGWLLAIYTVPAARGRPRAGLLGMLFLLASPLFLDISRTVHMEGPSESLAAAAVGCAMLGIGRSGVGRGRDRCAHHLPPTGCPRHRMPSILWWGAGGACAAVAVMTKLTAAASAVPLLALAVTGAPQERGKRLGALMGGAALGIASLLPAIAPRSFLTQTVVYHLSLAHRLGITPVSHAAEAAQFLNANWLLAAMAGAGACVAAVPKHRLESFALVWLGAEALAVCLVTPVWPHHFALLLSPLALLAGSAADRLPEWLSASARALRPVAAGNLVMAAVTAAAVGEMALAAGCGRQDVPPSDLVAIEAQIVRLVPFDGLMVTDDPMPVFLAHRRVPPNLIDSSTARWEAGSLSEADLRTALRDPRVRAVLLWRGTFEREFPDFTTDAAAALPNALAISDGRILLWRPPASP
jgi:4-amino-4-deoxy-L-arabinose transferase-like glycosyltransferase